ncbi:putative methyltransferase-domain-containing protein [Bisporella sp. PMI_857]|nr:putative methyltransferase-domain-containing protein [Bisporella sp. PMI_857]
MHYIRFLKPPRLSSLSPAVTAKITVTTDLGESFLLADIAIVVNLISENGTKIGKSTEYIWKGRNGMRSLEVQVPIPKSHGAKELRLLVRPEQVALLTDSFSSVISGASALDTDDQGRVITVRSAGINAKASAKSDEAISQSMAERVFRSNEREIHIWEETGESIARHIWDAGLVLSSYLATISTTKSEQSRLPHLQKTLEKKNLNILELGAGCGIVGITLSTYFPSSQVLLTDLPEATSILTRNLSLLPSSISHAIAQQVLDWSSPLPSQVQAERWDLVVVADCTYNPDVVPDLVTTLGRISDGNREVELLLAMKVRHESEAVFFELMEKGGWEVREKAILPLPVLGWKDEEIEVYLFKLRA